MNNHTEALTEYVRKLITCTDCEYYPGEGEDPSDVPYLRYRIEFPASWFLFVDGQNVVTACVNLVDPA